MVENVKQRSVRLEDVKQENTKPGVWGWNPQVYTHDVCGGVLGWGVGDVMGKMDSWVGVLGM